MARKRRTLSPEDQALWDQVRETAKPLSSRSKLANSTAIPTHTKPVPNRYQIQPLKTGQIRIPKAEPKTRLDLAPDPMQRLADAPVRTDKRTHDKIRKGRLKPDAKVDLHGLTADRAHAALTSFILRAHAQGHRLVLVITGKGRDPERDHDAIAPRRGILRHAVPQWLAQAPTAPLILQILPAHQRHGGGGAYYVYLKRVR